MNRCYQYPSGAQPRYCIVTAERPDQFRPFESAPRIEAAELPADFRIWKVAAEWLHESGAHVKIVSRYGD